MIEAQAFEAQACYEEGLARHGHPCPALPRGLRVGAAALIAPGRAAS